MMKFTKALVLLATITPLLAGIRSNDFVQAQETLDVESKPESIESRGIINPTETNFPDLSLEEKQLVENSLQKNNCALYYYGINCVYGNAGNKLRMEREIAKGDARPFTGDGSLLDSYIDRVGMDYTMKELERLHIDY